MHLMQNLSNHLRKKKPQLSRLTYRRAPAKGSNPVVTRNRRIAMMDQIKLYEEFTYY